MKSCPRQPNRTRALRAYLLMETLVYMGVVGIILGVGFVAMYRCVDNFVVLRRDADDISRVLNNGERWRAEVRSAIRGIRPERVNGEEILHLDTATQQLDYRFVSGALYRRIDTGPWVLMLGKVKSCSFQPERRNNITAWRWELELQPEVKGTLKAGRVRPLFTFLAVPRAAPQP